MVRICGKADEDKKKKEDPPEALGFEGVLKAELEIIRARRDKRSFGKNQGWGSKPFQSPPKDGRIPFLQESPGQSDALAGDTLGDDSEWNKWANSENEDRQGDLVGLAYSGGGIRSASFCLGVTQYLHKVGLFDRVDYMSTVSGGGYLGSCLSSVFAQNEGKEFPFHHELGKTEDVEFKHLRDHSSYLTSEGILDYLLMPTLFLRGLIINFLVVLPYVLIGALLLAVWVTLRPDDHFWLNRATLFFGGGFFVLAFVLYPVLQRIAGMCDYWEVPPSKMRKSYGKVVAFLLLGFLILLVFDLQPLILAEFRAQHDAGRSVLWDLGAEIKQIVAALSGVSAVVLGWMSAGNRELLNGLVGKVVLIAVGLLGFAFFWLIYISAAEWLLDGLNPNYRTLFALLTEHAYNWTTHNSWSFVVDIVTLGEDGNPTALRPRAGFLLSVSLSILLVMRLTTDVNFTSFHKFYRDRLAKAFLFTLPKEGETERVIDKNHPNDLLKMSQLDKVGGRPYHLVNTALNLAKDSDLELRGRSADFFLISQKFVGSKTTGYIPTDHVENLDPYFNLATAMTTSGAAVAPNMGSNTMKPLVFLMTMLNLRLGYWLPNPSWARPKSLQGRIVKFLFGKVGPLYLITEMFGKAGTWPHVNLSDGGHIENLGVYELLRRQCRLIVSVDGEADGDLQFHGLATVIRYARIDLGVNIEMDGLDKIRSGEQPWAVGRIQYGGGREGILLYLKSSFNGGDDPIKVGEDGVLSLGDTPEDGGEDLFAKHSYLANYKARHPDFPHQSTADQFFDEEQFECYRALGNYVGWRAFEGAKNEKREEEGDER